MRIHPAAELFPGMSPDEFAALKADIAVHGVREPSWVYQGILLDGRHLTRACEELGIDCPQREYEGSDPVAFVVSLNLKRRHLNESQRAVVGAKLANLKHGVRADTQTCLSAITQPQAAAMLNTSTRAIQEAKRIEREAPDLMPKIEAGTMSLHSAARTIERRESAQRMADPKPVTVAGIIQGDFRERASAIADASVDLVFTDPPYDRESVHLYEDAAREAARILKPGGSFIAYGGQYLLPEILSGCAAHLRLWWINACVHGGQMARMTEYGIVVHWKPLVWFVKGTRGDKLTFVDDAITGTREKFAHPWQQSEAEASYYIEKLTAPNGLVVDFFLGGGTTAAAAEKAGRRWVGFEIDPLHAKSASDRIESLRKEAA